MKRAYREVVEMARQKKCSLRVAAYGVALQRIAMSPVISMQSWRHSAPSERGVSLRPGFTDVSSLRDESPLKNLVKKENKKLLICLTATTWARHHNSTLLNASRSVVILFTPKRCPVISQVGIARPRRASAL